jgi:hypothetical protein
VIEKAIVQDDFVKDNEVHEKSNDVVVNDKNEKDIFGASSSSGFQMPANFDLPDEIIQEQLPAAKFTSTPIRYGGSGIVEKDKTETDPSEILRKTTASKESAAAKERSSLKKGSLNHTLLAGKQERVSEKQNHPQPAAKQERISEKQREGHLKSKTVLPVVEDLAEKRKRLMLKLRYDEDDIIDEKLRKQEKKGKIKELNIRFYVKLYYPKIILNRETFLQLNSSIDSYFVPFFFNTVLNGAFFYGSLAVKRLLKLQSELLRSKFGT